MKKFSRIKLVWISRNAWRRYLKSKAVRSDQISNKFHKIPRNFGPRTLGARIPMPRMFCLDTNYQETCEAINKMRSSLLPQSTRKGLNVRALHRQQPYYDFRTIEHITPGAALVLAAEYDRMRRLAGRKLWTIDLESWNPTVYASLNEIGFLKLLDVEKKELPCEPENSVRILKFITGLGSDGLAAAKLTQEMRSIAGEIEGGNFLFDGITEAMTNVTHHAYPDDHKFRYYPLRNRWWLTGAYYADEKKLKVIIFDQGITIPGHIPRSKKKEQIRSMFYKMFNSLLGTDMSDDGKIINAAMEVSRSSTGDEHRGKGLANMLDFVDNSADGYLRIVSRRGEYVYHKGQQPIVHEHPTSVGGTLIEWQIQR